MVYISGSCWWISSTFFVLQKACASIESYMAHYIQFKQFVTAAKLLRSAEEQPWNAKNSWSSDYLSIKWEINKYFAGSLHDIMGSRFCWSSASSSPLPPPPEWWLLYCCNWPSFARLVIYTLWTTTLFTVLLIICWARMHWFVCRSITVYERRNMLNIRHKNGVIVQSN